MNEGHVHQSREILNERELRLVDYEEEHDRFLELRKLIEQNERDICLEVEINESLRNLLQSSKRCDDHFDVIIQQADSHHETKVSLSINELNNFIEMVNYHNEDRKNLAETGGSFQSAKSNRKNHLFNCVTGEEMPETLSSLNTETDFTTHRNQEVYTTPHHTFEKLQKKLPCLNPNPSDKPGTPCLCQHCGMVGVLVESQKRPAIPHTPNPKMSKPAQNRRRVIDLRSKSKSETNLLLLQELSKKINSLEVRLNEYEQRTVKKDYFKYVINTMLAQYNEQINNLKEHRFNKQGIHISTQYSKTDHPFRNMCEDNKKPKYCEEPEREIKHRSPKIMESCESIRLSESASEKKVNRRERSTTRDYSKQKGRDRSSSGQKNERAFEMKTRVATMMEEKVKKKLDRGRKVERPEDLVLKLPSNTDNIKPDQSKALYYTQNLKTSPFRSKRKEKDTDVDEARSLDSLEQLCEQVCRQYYDKKEDQKCRLKKPHSVIPDKLLKGRKDERQRKKTDKNDISYIYPAAKNWDEKSTDYEGLIPEKQLKKPKHSEEEKMEYLRMLAKNRNIDECELWCNILTQAKDHIKSNEDTVSIQLPSGSKNRNMSELEITLTNLKEIVKNVRNVKKSQSKQSIDNKKLSCKTKTFK